MEIVASRFLSGTVIDALGNGSYIYADNDANLEYAGFGFTAGFDVTYDGVFYREWGRLYFDSNSNGIYEGTHVYTSEASGIIDSTIGFGGEGIDQHYGFWYSLEYTRDRGNNVEIATWDRSIDSWTGDFEGVDGLGRFEIISDINFDTSSEDDLFVGSTNDDTIFGFDGNDTFAGRLGNDFLNGDNGNDTLYGDSGNDNLSGGSGIDSLFGGNGEDNLNGGSGDDTLDGGLGDDFLAGESGNDLLAGGLGVDSLFGGDGHDALVGNAGNDLLSGEGFSDSLHGGDGDDSLFGGDGDDILYGDTDNDLLVGSTGADTLYGGSGADKFFFNSTNDSGIESSARDIIKDFLSSENDKIDLSAIDANINLEGDQQFTYIGSASFTNLGHQARFSDGILYLTTDADTDAEMAIELTNVSSLSSSDFIL